MTRTTTLVLLLGFGIRLLLHDYHGLEGDDAFSLALSRLETAELLRGLAALELDIHPPLHFLALKAWTALAGESLLSLRLFNILLDVLTGALMMRVAGRFFGRRASFLAGALWLVAPLLIYGTYLIRMYTLLGFFSVAAFTALAEASYRRRPLLWIALSAALALAAAYTHIVGALISVVLAFSLLVSVRQFRHMLVGLGLFAIAVVLYLPYAGAVWAVYQSGRPLGAEISEASFNDPLSALGAVVTTVLSHRITLNNLVAAAMVVVLLIGSIWLARRRHTLPLLTVTWLGLIGMAGLAWIAGFYKARYLLPLVPLTLIVSGGIVDMVTRRLRLTGYAIFAVLVMGSLWSVRHDLDRSLRDDWVAAARFVEDHERPDDLIVVVPDWGQEAFQYHYMGDLPVTGLFAGVSLDLDIDALLAGQLRDAARVWYINYQPEVSDPAGRVADWFRSRAVTLTEVFPAGMRVHYFDMQPVKSDLPDDARALDAVFGDVLRLHGVYLPVGQGPARDARLHPPSNWVQVILYWEALQPDLLLMPRVRLTDPYAQVYGAALERQPTGVLEPVSDWGPGQIWQVAYDLNLNPETPSGVYNIEVMVLDAGEPVFAEGADAGEFWVIAGQFVVE